MCRDPWDDAPSIETPAGHQDSLDDVRYCGSGSAPSRTWMFRWRRRGEWPRRPVASPARWTRSRVVLPMSGSQTASIRAATDVSRALAAPGYRCRPRLRRRDSSVGDTSRLFCPGHIAVLPNTGRAHDRHRPRNRSPRPPRRAPERAGAHSPPQPVLRSPVARASVVGKSFAVAATAGLPHRIYHLALRDEWQDARDGATYRRSRLPRST